MRQAFQSYKRTARTLCENVRPLLFLLLKIKGYFVFVLFPVGPTFDLETKKKFFCWVSDYALSDGGNRFAQFGLFHTVIKRHFSVRRSN